jgi:hypothetical protein
MILLDAITRRCARVPTFMRVCFGIITYRFVPRRFFCLFFDQDARDSLAEVDAVFGRFPVDQRIHLYLAVVCHSSLSIFALALTFSLMFLQNTLSSDIVVASWFSILSSQIKASIGDADYELFWNYRELTNWEYLINDHFVFLLFFAIMLRCQSFVLFLVLVPNFIATAAGLQSNHNKSIDIHNIDSWFYVTLAVSYFLCFIINALAFRDVCGAFIKRSNDRNYVSQNTMLELSHEFVSRSHLAQVALDGYCKSSAPECAQRVQCMMWLLRKQRLEVERFRPNASRGLESGSSSQPASRIRTLLSEEFGCGDNLRFGAWFASMCKECQCEVSIDFTCSKHDDAIVEGAESELRHFLGSFAVSTLMHVSKHFADGSAPVRICFEVSICRAGELNAILTQQDEGHSSDADCRRVSAPCAAAASCSPRIEHEMNFVQMIAMFRGPMPPAASPKRSAWMHSFVENDNFSALEFAARLHGFIRTPRNSSSEPHRFISACALPCRLVTASEAGAVRLARAASPALPLYVLLIEDRLELAEVFIAKIKRSPWSADYEIRHCTNVEAALALFSDSNVSSAGGVEGASFSIVFIDKFMPMRIGERENSQAGVRALHRCVILVQLRAHTLLCSGPRCQNDSGDRGKTFSAELCLGMRGR